MTKAITLHQPWASLIALGVKTIETRSWKPPAALLGERLLIHAGAKAVAVRHSHQIGEWRTYGADGVLTTSPRPARMYERSTGWAKRPEDAVVLPFGAILASCTLAAVVPMVVAGTVDALTAMRLRSSGALVVNPDGPEMAYYHPQMADDEMSRDVSDQRPYGDFAPGRWAWLLEDVKPTTERCPACWGTGWVCDQHRRGACNEYHDLDSSLGGCPICTPAGGYDGSGRSEPVPAKGHQRVWEWTP